MKKTFVALQFILGYTFAHAQAPDFSWVKQTSGPDEETPVSISLDASGNIYTSGYFKDTVDFDPGAGTYTMASPAADVSMYITKHDVQGNLVWAKQVSTPVSMGGAEAHPSSQQLCSNGDICIAGFYSGAFDFDPGAGNFYMAAQNEKAFVLKLDANGNFVWSRQWGTNKSSMANGLALDGSDAIYTTGFFIDTVDFDPGVQTFTLATDHPNTPESFISKLDASGNFVWVKKLASDSGSIGNAIALDASGNIFSTGTFLGTSDFDPGAGTSTVTSIKDQDIYVWKMNTSGGLVWAKTMGGTTKEAGTAILPDASGNVFVSGFFSGTCDLDPGTGTQNFTSSGDDDLFTVKLDGQGNLLWAHGMGGSKTDVVSAMALDANGAVYSTGLFSGTVDFDAGSGTHTLSTSAINAFISKYDTQGNFKWAKHLSGNGYGGGSDIAINSSGEVFSVGVFSLSTDFDPNSGTYTLSASGQVDAYLHKMSCGISPNIGATSSAPLLCSGGSATLTPSGASTYSWNTVAGTSLVVNPITTTDYTLTGKDQNGCISEVAITQHVTDCTGLESYAAMGTINVFPNPNNGEFQITASSSAQVTIYNNLGTIVCKKEIRSGVTEISIKEFSSGIYFLEVIGNGERQVFRMIKN